MSVKVIVPAVVLVLAATGVGIFVLSHAQRNAASSQAVAEAVTTPIAKTPTLAPTSVAIRPPAPAAESLMIVPTKANKPVDSLDPLVIVADDPALLKWYQARDAAVAADATAALSPEDQKSLLDALQATKLPADVVLALGRATHAHYKDDYVAASLVYSVAGDRVKTALADAKKNGQPTLPLVEDLKHHRLDFKKVMWYRIDREGDPRCVQGVYDLYQSMSDYCPPTDKGLVSVATEARIGMCECLDMMGKTKEANALCEQVSVEDLSQARRGALDYTWGNTLERLERYSDAAERFEACAKNDKAYARQSAAYQTVRCRISDHDAAHAEEALTYLVTTFSPSKEREEQLRSQIDALKSPAPASSPTTAPAGPTASAGNP